MSPRLVGETQAPERRSVFVAFDCLVSLMCTYRVRKIYLARTPRDPLSTCKLERSQRQVDKY